MKVLVAIDHKPSSQAIIDALIKMHWFEGCELHVMTARAAGESIEDIEDLAVELHNALPQCQVTFLAPEGDPKAAILGMGAKIQADLIVLGSNCKNTLERLLIGSVCQGVIDEAHCPVIVAKTPCCLAREASPAFRTILIPVDNSVFSDVAVNWLGNFGWGPECKFIVTAVVDEDTNMAQVKQSLRERAISLSKLLGTSNVITEPVVGEPRQAILDLAKKHYADMITIGSHGRTGLRKLILGNVGQSLIQDAPCAVAIVRGVAADDESWQDTGLYAKVEPISVAALVPARRRDDGDITAHVMPGGM